MPPIGVQAMLQGLYNTTLEFFDLGTPGRPAGESIESLTSDQLDPTEPMRRGLETQLARSQAEVIRLQERCAALEKALKGTREVLQAREAELERRGQWAGNGSMMMLEEQQARSQSSELFLTRTDSWSGASVIQAVCDINSELIGFSSSAIELSFERRTDASSQAMQDTSARLGPNIARVLEAWPSGGDPTLVGLVLQAGIATCIARALAAFALGLPPKAETTLSQVYSHIFFAEPQPTSARWRALTHRHVHTLYPGLAEYSAQDLTETITRWASDILLAVGAESSRKWIRETFGEQIGRIVKSVLAFAQLCKEGIMSSNFDMVLIEGNQPFDERVMVDVFEGPQGDGRLVLATTELGLRRMTRKTVGGGGMDDDGGAGTVEHQVLVKPKVLLDSVLSTTFI
ncbi:hypothetical protein C8F01DRAFT_1120000 [Mycena amicta]|nr:hypothetical protein C8F01DRAFT_1120000 [Mycena amicta]